MPRSIAHIRSNASYDLARYRTRGGRFASQDGERFDVTSAAWRRDIKISARRQERRFVAVNAVAEDLALDDDEAFDAFEQTNLLEELLSARSYHGECEDEWPWWNPIENKWEF